MILGLHGKIGSGKNECARRLAVISALPVIEVSFAAKLKQSAAALLGCSVDDLERWKNDPQKIVAIGAALDGYDIATLPGFTQTLRSFLQRYGTEAHRDIFGEDFWLDAALPIHSVAVGAYSDALYVVTDVRFENEAQRVRDLGGVVVRVVGPNNETGDHRSERALNCDCAIVNTTRDDNFQSLDRQLRALLRKLNRQGLLTA